MDKSRIGYIEISNQMLEDFWLNNREVVPLKCVDEKHKDSIRYMCWCKHFRDLNEGDLIPYYEFIFKRDEKSGLTLLLNINEVEYHEPTPCEHEFILTQRIPDVGYYSEGFGGKKDLVDLEFVCPKCGEIKCYTKNVSSN